MSMDALATRLDAAIAARDEAASELDALLLSLRTTDDPWAYGHDEALAATMSVVTAGIGIEWATAVLEAVIRYRREHKLSVPPLEATRAMKLGAGAFSPVSPGLPDVEVGDLLYRETADKMEQAQVQSVGPHIVTLDQQILARGDALGWSRLDQRQTVRVPGAYADFLVRRFAGVALVAGTDTHAEYCDLAVSDPIVQQGVAATVEAWRSILPTHFSQLPDHRVATHLGVYGHWIDLWHDPRDALRRLELSLWSGVEACEARSVSGKTLQRAKNPKIRAIYDTIAERAGSSRCQVCDTRPATIVDHDHLTGAVRGILCHLCNNMVDSCIHLPTSQCSSAHYLDAPPAAELGLMYPGYATRLKERRQRATVAMLIETVPELAYLAHETEHFADYGPEDFWVGRTVMP